MVVDNASVCAGEDAHLRWVARGDLELTAALRDPRLIPSEGVAADQDRAFAPDTIKFTLSAKDAKNDKDAVRYVTLEVYPSTPTTAVVFSTAPQGDFVIASGQKNPARWNDRFEIETVSAEGRDLIVTHDQKQASLTKDGPAVGDFRGSRVAGAWEFRSRLIGAETQGIGVPEKLSIHVTMRCRAEKR